MALFLGFHALGNHLQPQAVGQRDDGAHDGGVVRVGQQVVHKALVDLELAQRHAFEVGERGIAGAKVVQRKTHAMRAQRLHGGDGLGHVFDQQAFRQLQLELRRRGAGDGQHAQHVGHEAGIAKLARADVHGHGQRRQIGLFLPRRQTRAGGVQHPAPQWQDETGLFCRGYELGG